MSEIASLDRKVNAAEGQIASLHRELESSPDDFALKMSIESLEAHLEELQVELRLAKERREREVLELRFTGADVRLGAMPLHVAGRLLSQVSDAIYESSYYVRHGEPHLKGPIPADLIRLLDLRLTNIASGSARLYISGAISPDLFGNSLLESSLRRCMLTFKAESDDEIANAVSDIGLSAAKKIGAFLKELYQNELSLQMEWEPPEKQAVIWSGDTTSIKRLHKQLGRIKEMSKDVWLDSVHIVSLSTRGYVELRDQTNVTHRYSYSHDIYPTVRSFRIGDLVDAKVKIKEFVNQATGATKQRRQILTLRDPEKFKAIPRN